MIGMCFLTGIAPTAALVGTASFKQSVNLAKQGGSPALALASTARSVANRAVAPPPTRLAPPPMRMEMVVHNRRRLETVSDTSGLVSALSGSALTIELEAGTYTISSTLTISRDVTIKAKVSGSSVVLDGGGSTQIMQVNNGNEAHLIGLTFKDGKSSVSVPAGPYSPSSGMKKLASCVVSHNRCRQNVPAVSTHVCARLSRVCVCAIGDGDWGP